MMFYRLKKLFPLLFFSLTGAFFYACDKEAEQPIPVAPKKATLNVEVMHHSWAVAGIPVYLKKNVTEFPGFNTSAYEYSQVTNQEGYVQFRDLSHGSYYLFVTGWDPVFNDSVIGYKPVIINDSSAAGGIIDDRIFVSE